MLQIVSYKTPDKIKIGANLALKHRLYVSGWALSEYLVDARTYPEENAHAIYLAFDNNIPIGVCLVAGKPSKRFGQIFVRKARRRQGVGTKLMNQAATDWPDMHVDRHDTRSTLFFNSLNCLTKQWWELL